MILFEKTQEREEVIVDVLLEEDVDDNSHLVVYNDDVNTFDWVIKAFMEICKHSSQQAEQLSLIVHFKGKATVKSAAKNVLRPMCEGLLDRGISAEIED